MAIGIDLGTQSCRVAVWQNGHSVILSDDEGNRSFASYVSFSKDKRLVGNVAKAQHTVNVRNTVYGAKRLLGRNFRDFEVQEDMKTLPYQCLNKAGVPYAQAPEEIIAMQLSKLKKMAESHLSGDSGRVVISIPPGFNIIQRQAVKDACEIAGIRNPHLLSETSASALYYSFYSMEAKVIGERKVLILDVGSAVSSASILVMEDGIVEVKATASHLHIGGDNFDSAFANQIAAKLQKKYSIDVSANPRAMARIRLACERAKRSLSSAHKATIDLEGVSSEIPDVAMAIKREDFDVVFRDLFKSALEPVTEVLRQSLISRGSLNEVVLVGGATRMPGLVTALSTLLGERAPAPITIRNLDEAVVYGTAIYAAMLSAVDAPADHSQDVLRDVMLLDIVHHSLGVAAIRNKDPQALPPDGSAPHESVFKKIIPRNSASTVKKSEVFTTSNIEQTTTHIQVYEGESEQPSANIFLGSFELSRIQKIEKGPKLPVVQLEFDLHTNLVVSARDVGNPQNSIKSMTVRVGRLSQFDKDLMVERAKKLDALDRRLESRTRRRNALEEYCYNARETLASFAVEVDGCLGWLDDSTTEVVTDEQYAQRERALLASLERLLPPGCVISQQQAEPPQ